VTRPDLLDRSILVTLPSVPEEARKEEEAFWSDFAGIQSRVLGALFDALSGALLHKKNVKLKKLPRMADFATWVTAAEPALGWKHGSFVAAYRANRQDAGDIALESSPIVPPVLRLVEQAPIWEGTATDLLKALAALVDESAKKQKAWPSNGKGLSDALRRLVGPLRRAGAAVTLHGARIASGGGWSPSRGQTARTQGLSLRPLVTPRTHWERAQRTQVRIPPERSDSDEVENVR
jgi:hypothetical protein